MRLFVGLGNPGAKYQGNRHNIGFMAVDAIALRHRFSPWRSVDKFLGEVSEGVLEDEKIVLLKPKTFMNDSGFAVRKIYQFYRLHTFDVCVFHDEIELPPAAFRVKIGGQDAGHNGLRSISNSIGSEYRRVRIGVGRPQFKDQVHSYVLDDFALSEIGWVKTMIDAIASNVNLLVRNNDSSFQNKVHLALQDKGFGNVGNRRQP